MPSLPKVLALLPRYRATSPSSVRTTKLPSPFCNNCALLAHSRCPGLHLRSPIDEIELWPMDLHMRRM